MNADEALGRTPDRHLVWVVGADQWPRACLRAELIERGYDAIGFVSLGHAAAGLAIGGDDHPRPRVIVIDLAGQAAGAAPLAALGATGAALIATGGAVELGRAEVAAFPWAAILPRPVTIGALADAVARCVAPEMAP
jgi:hypothetical protein